MLTFEDLSRAAVAGHAARVAASDKIETADLPSPVSVTRPPSADASSLLLPRTQILHLGAAVGQLCSTLLTHGPLDPPGRDPLAKGVDESIAFPATLAEMPGSYWHKDTNTNTDPHILAGRTIIARSMGSVFLALFLTASACRVNLRSCIVQKLELNGKKYPVELCRGKSGKYTDYSEQTGITADRKSQSTVDTGGNDQQQTHEDEDMADQSTIVGLTARIRAFATDRRWSRYHTPRNIVLAMMGEVGELAELFQWKGDGDDGAPAGLSNWTEEEVDHVKQELADVTIYLMRLADVCGVDIAEEAMSLTSGTIE